MILLDSDPPPETACDLSHTQEVSGQRGRGLGSWRRSVSSCRRRCRGNHHLRGWGSGPMEGLPMTPTGPRGAPVGHSRQEGEGHGSRCASRVSQSCLPHTQIHTHIMTPSPKWGRERDGRRHFHARPIVSLSRPFDHLVVITSRGDLSPGTQILPFPLCTLGNFFASSRGGRLVFVSRGLPVSFTFFLFSVSQ